jgi:hypothetical protein
MRFEDPLLAQDQIQGPIDGLLLGLRAEESLRAVDLPLIELEVLVPSHVHESA